MKVRQHCFTGAWKESPLHAIELRSQGEPVTTYTEEQTVKKMANMITMYDRFIAPIGDQSTCHPWVEQLYFTLTQHLQDVLPPSQTNLRRESKASALENTPMGDELKWLLKEGGGRIFESCYISLETTFTSHTVRPRQSADCDHNGPILDHHHHLDSGAYALFWLQPTGQDLPASIVLEERKRIYGSGAIKHTSLMCMHKLQRTFSQKKTPVFGISKPFFRQLRQPELASQI